MPRRPAASSDVSHYVTLGVREDASQAEIRRAYRKLALEHHPDKQPAGSDQSVAAAATRRLAQINGAWDVIGDEERRHRYDSREADGEAEFGEGAVRSAHCSTAEPLHGHPRCGTCAITHWGGFTITCSGRPALLFVHLGGSPRASRSADACA